MEKPLDTIEDIVEALDSGQFSVLIQAGTPYVQPFIESKTEDGYFYRIGQHINKLVFISSALEFFF